MSLFWDKFFFRVWLNGVLKSEGPRALEFKGAGVNVAVNQATNRVEISLGTALQEAELSTEDDTVTTALTLACSPHTRHDVGIRVSGVSEDSALITQDVVVTYARVGTAAPAERGSAIVASTNEVDAGVGYSVAVDGNNLLIQVTGAEDKAWNWHVQAWVTETALPEVPA